MRNNICSDSRFSISSFPGRAMMLNISMKSLPLIQRVTTCRVPSRFDLNIFYFQALSDPEPCGRKIPDGDGLGALKAQPRWDDGNAGHWGGGQLSAVTSRTGGCFGIYTEIFPHEELNR